MMTLSWGPENAHQTTLRILQQLRKYSWDAKALIALAAFALEYGNFWNLQQASDPLGNSLRLLNQIQHRQLPVTDINATVKLVMEAVEKIRRWGTLSSDETYETEDVPALSDALQLIPLLVYWVVASLVACNTNIQGVSNYALSDFRGKLSTALDEFKHHLEICEQQKASIEDYRRRKKAFKKPKDIVDFLKLLINQNGYKSQIYDGNANRNVNVEVFKEKYVLLFISGLDRIEDEIRLLNSIYERLVEDPNDKSGFKKEEFKILWIPIENKWGDARRELFNTLKSDIKWYVVEYAQVPLPGIRLIEEDLRFHGKPILPVVKPQGVLLNDDALDIIFEWGIHAFPFRKSDAYLLAQKWKWFWDEVKKTNLHGIQVKGDRYIFIYGGSDKWTREFTVAVDKIKRHDTIRRADAIIDYYHLGKDDPKIVPRFWIGIEGKRQKKHSENLDCEIQEIIRSLLCLKQDTQGWAILSKGSNVRILGHGQPMYQTVADFEKWKERVLVKEGFDIAFQEYYDTQRDLPAPQPCEFNTLDVLATITCPNASCGRVMEVTSVNYKCCHGGNVADHAIKSRSTTAT
ncbi:Protein SIEVE ELEMENT OCCLUSION B isoform B [Glycine soja]|nr:Protein SIEVE ELEMENT OCCLUSION B isoform B [Glycine soja]